MKKGIVYYTHRGRGPIYDTCREQIDRARGDITVVSVSLAPLGWHFNIVLDLEPGDLTMFKQQLAGLTASDADVVYFCEHDVLYHPSHFDFVPPRSDCYYFNLNVWAVDAQDGKALYYDGMKMTSGCVAYRDILIEHYTKKIAWVEREGGKFSRRAMGYEPGRKGKPGRTEDYDWDTFRSAFPNIDIKNCGNVTNKRFNISRYRANRKMIERTWVLSDSVPYWGKTKGRFDDFLAECRR